MSSVLVTGANGFIGRTLCPALAAQGWAVRAATRQTVGDIGPQTDWREALDGVAAVVHLAAIADTPKGADALALCREVNRDGTLRLALQAVAQGVKRLVFVSSAKVNGEFTTTAPFRASDTPQPQDAYAISKFEAEQALHELARETGLEVVIVRPPLVVGPGAGGNFRRLLRAVARGLPLPLGAVDNRRSLVHVDNFVSAIALCLSHPAAAGRTWLVGDEPSLNTAHLWRLLAGGMGVKSRLLPVPPVLLRAAGRLTGLSAQVGRLLGSLEVDSTPIREELGWVPQVEVEAGLRAIAARYREEHLA